MGKKISQNVYISNNYEKISGKSGLTLKYDSCYHEKNREELLKVYKEEEKRDIILGKTNFGIHKDDYIFYLNDCNLKDYGSEGEQKNAIISLKMAEIEIFKSSMYRMIPFLIINVCITIIYIRKMYDKKIYNKKTDVLFPIIILVVNLILVYFLIIINYKIAV